MRWLSLFRKHQRKPRKRAGNQDRQLLFVAYILFAGMGFEKKQPPADRRP